jgi:hypothetical protein
MIFFQAGDQAMERMMEEICWNADDQASRTSSVNRSPRASSRVSISTPPTNV